MVDLQERTTVEVDVSGVVFPESEPQLTPPLWLASPLLVVTLQPRLNKP